MLAEIHNLEESLKDFLTAAQNDSYNSRSANFYKYNNLKIWMEPNRNKTPHLIIQIGISEAMYNIDTTDKLSGGLGSDEKYVRRWLEKSFIKSDLNSAWTKTSKIKPVSMNASEDDDY